MQSVLMAQGRVDGTSRVISFAEDPQSMKMMALIKITDARPQFRQEYTLIVPIVEATRTADEAALNRLLGEQLGRAEAEAATRQRQFASVMAGKPEAGMKPSMSLRDRSESPSAPRAIRSGTVKPGVPR